MVSGQLVVAMQCCAEAPAAVPTASDDIMSLGIRSSATEVLGSWSWLRCYPLLFVASRCYALLFVATRCHAPLVVTICCHSLLLAAISGDSCYTLL